MPEREGPSKNGSIHDATVEEEKEQKENEPKIEVHFFFSTHLTKKDFSRLSGALKGVDVFIPEFMGWNYRVKEVFQWVSDGLISPQEAVEVFAREYPRTPDFDNFEAQFKAIYNRKIRVIFVDLTYEQTKKFISRDTGMLKDLEMAHAATGAFVAGDLEMAMGAMRYFFSDYLEQAKEREPLMIENIKKEIINVRNKFPELKDKEKIKFLISLGASHTDFFWTLKKEFSPQLNIETTRQLGRSTIVFGKAEELLRKGIDFEQIDDETLAQIVMSQLLQSWFVEITHDSAKAMWAARKLAERLSLENIQAVCDAFRLRRITSVTSVHDLQPTLTNELANFGIVLPTSKKDVDKLLNIKTMSDGNYRIGHSKKSSK